MSILIKGMEIPKNCGECPFATPTRDGLMCDAVSFLAKCLVHPVSRMSCCPLVELPPHGRLIDADMLYKAIRTDIMGGLNYEYFIETAPTIIESEGEDG